MSDQRNQLGMANSNYEEEKKILRNKADFSD